MFTTIYILWLRQLKRFFRSKTRIVGSLGQPILFLFAMGYGFGSVFKQAGQGDYIQFLVPGIVAMSVLFASIFSGIEIIWDRQFGFLKETLVAPVSRLSIMIGRTLGGATVAIFQGTVIFLISFIVGFHPVSIAGALLAFLMMLITALFFTAVGTAIASTLRDSSGFQLIMNFLIMPLYFLSGALFPLAGLSGWMERIVYLNPLSYAVDGLRGGLIGVSHFGLGIDFAVMGIATAIVLVIGSHLFSKIQI
ncbi:MAG: ABC transporter permease [Patescibacteria group bacterium]|jgi:ABC-2 type transport system permease protein